MRMIKPASVIATSVLLFGCASGARFEQMVAAPDAPNTYPQPLHSQIDISKTLGGRPTNPMWMSDISNESFQGAVKQSLRQEGLYNPNGRYKLAIELLQVERPLFGIDARVTTHVNYTLTDSQTRHTLFEETVSAPYTARFSDALIAVERLRLANEGSGRENIKALLEMLSELSIDPNQVSLADE